MPELLLEILSEEIPARMQARAAEDLRRLVTERLTGAGLAFKEARAYVTPRRLALAVTSLPVKQPDTLEEKKGPRLGAPKKAIQGFLKGNGLRSLDEAELRETDKGSFYFLARKRKGQASAKVLPGIIVEAIQALGWPKSMRWGDGKFVWVRPLHGVTAVFDGKKLRGAMELGNGATLAFGNATVGHRFLAPRKFTVTGFADYKKKLKAAKVILDPAERRASIEKQAKRIAARAKLAVRDDPALLDEVTGLVEWPVVLMGRIEDQFMELPPEVLASSMRAHQKYLALVDESGALANRFLVVANMETADKGKAIAAGNERVLRARLADARFFWDQDRKQTLAARTPLLGQIVFHAKLGSLDEKIDRVQALAAEIAGHVEGADKDRVRSAARLCKADLVTGMVGEFPELQGVMGRYYALADGEHAEVAEAIAEHYAPQGPSDACPSAPVSVALALADKIDTLVGFFAIDEKPTGSKDPYALRRAALGVIRLIVENGLRIHLTRIFDLSHQMFFPLWQKEIDFVAKAEHVLKRMGLLEQDELRGSLLDFFAERLKVALRGQGVRHDLIAAVFALGGEDDLVRLLARVEALAAFLKTEDGANLLVAYQRAANIVRIEEKRDKLRYHGAELAIDQLVEDAERLLGLRVFDSEAEAEKALAAEDFTAAMAALAKLRKPVDDFFDRVTVNTDNPELRANRLRLLARIGATLNQVADFSKIEG
jgi:glycyl-tRNA synthetase beta chain